MYSEPPNDASTLPETRAAVRGVHVEADEADVLLGQAVGLQHTVGGDLEVRAAELRDLAAPQVVDRLDVGARGHREVDRVVDAGRGQELGLEPARAADDRRQVPQPGGEVELARGQGLVERRPGAAEERPAHLDAGLVLQLGLDELVDVRDRHVVAVGERPVVEADAGVADPDRGPGVGGRGRHQAGDERAGQQVQSHRCPPCPRLRPHGRSGGARPSGGRRWAGRRRSTGTSPSIVVRRTTLRLSP